MMKIPYLSIMEIGSLKRDLNNSKMSIISRVLYRIGYNLQCKPIIKVLKKSKTKINHIYNTDLIEFAKFVNQSGYEQNSIKIIVNNFYGFTHCSISFINLSCVLKADSKSKNVQYITRTRFRDVKKELASLNTRVSPYKEIYNEMVDFIINYLTMED